jgi:hypothetical protein
MNRLLPHAFENRCYTLKMKHSNVLPQLRSCPEERKSLKKGVENK